MGVGDRLTADCPLPTADCVGTRVGTAGLGVGAFKGVRVGTAGVIGTSVSRIPLVSAK